MLPRKVNGCAVDNGIDNQPATSADSVATAVYIAGLTASCHLRHEQLVEARRAAAGQPEGPPRLCRTGWRSIDIVWPR